ncbi:TPA: V-type ATP synthase subunit D [Candidatus Woesearchaeota archaeon]|nr:MAG: V-type H+-transporting ATPase subunit D [archaeon GW2011_AR11]HIH05091.1 V-type ATP synthase subunit D [Candidatus Woesearchaeota archaeon]HII64080.1 V-type ATP synthase subunit D [Candidatus Woesearchaeota archaeon]HIJ19152.1 V-type ATP synthase subunit D [Candidatus Woesearchaeota archaeon]
MAQDIKPTRSELMKVKKQVKLAQTGHKLLKKKRDGLILEFFKLLKKAKTLRAELAAIYVDAVKRMNVARVMESDLKLKSVALAIKSSDELEIRRKNIMGVPVLTIAPPKVRKGFFERGYGVFTSAAITEAAKSYEQVVEKIIEVAEFETSLRRMLAEIEKTKRRVNALEFNVLPRLEKDRNFIRLRLEEMERENVFRMKRIKG